MTPLHCPHSDHLQIPDPSPLAADRRLIRFLLAQWVWWIGWVSTTCACVLQVLHLQVPPPTHSPHSYRLHVTDPSRSLADHVPSAILIRPRLGACTSRLLQSVLPVKGWTSARPQIVENPLPLTLLPLLLPIALFISRTYHPQPAASSTLYLSHCSHSLSSRLPQQLQPGRSRLILHSDTSSIETNIAFPLLFRTRPHPPPLAHSASPLTFYRRSV